MEPDQELIDLLVQVIKNQRELTFLEINFNNFKNEDLNQLMKSFSQQIMACDLSNLKVLKFHFCRSSLGNKGLSWLLRAIGQMRNLKSL